MNVLPRSPGALAGAIRPGEHACMCVYIQMYLCMHMCICVCIYMCRVFVLSGLSAKQARGPRTSGRRRPQPTRKVPSTSASPWGRRGLQTARGRT